MNVQAPEFSRNLGFISEAEQECLNGSVVAVAGAGGDGGALAVQLARLGVGELRLADPDTFETENINRQESCTTETVGVNKAEAVGRTIRAINPDIKVVTYTDGVHPGNVEQFVEGASLLIDETEFTKPEIGVMLAREARRRNISDLMAMNIGFGATVTSFKPDGFTFERLMGLPEDMPLDEVAGQEISLSRWLAYLPSYADLATFQKVADGEKSAPSVAPGVALAAGTAAVQALLHLTKDVPNHRPAPVSAPHTIMIDAMSIQAKVIKHPRVSYYWHLAKMVSRNMLHLAPKASY